MSITSFINLKGGVGKSTTTVAFAEFLAGYHHRRVLVIDLDPQTNASIALVGDERWSELNRNGQTLHHVFLTPFASPPHPFGLGDIITSEASSVLECAGRIDLLASSTNLIGQEGVVEAVAAVSHYEMESHLVLAAAFAEDPGLLHRYDDVLIDCPPSLNIVTLNGLCLSDAYLIPVMAEPISIYGIPQIIERVARLKARFGHV
nr:AAA family ATPase [Ktedonobacterales bacterium]